jgi:osmotically-inducible protein OsmY
VQLSGFVDTAGQKTRAEQIAAGISGVTSVKNNITLKGNTPNAR